MINAWLCRVQQKRPMKHKSRKIYHCHPKVFVCVCNQSITLFTLLHQSYIYSEQCKSIFIIVWERSCEPCQTKVDIVCPGLWSLCCAPFQGPSVEDPNETPSHNVYTRELFSLYSPGDLQPQVPDKGWEIFEHFLYKLGLRYKKYHAKLGLKYNCLSGTNCMFSCKWRSPVQPLLDTAE